MTKKEIHDRPGLTIVIPAYREEKRIGKTLDELAHYLVVDKSLKKVKVEVIVVSADSGDKTQDIVKSKQKNFGDLSLIKPGKKVGKGRDVKLGMLSARGRAVIFMDADLSTPLVYLREFYKSFISGSDVIIATRNLHRHHPNYMRRALSNGGNLLFRIASGIWVEDFTMWV